MTVSRTTLPGSALLLATILLAGCTALAPAPQPAPTSDTAPIVKPDSTVPILPPVTPRVEIPVGTVASGVFASGTRGVGGELTIVFDGSNFSVDESAVTATGLQQPLLGLTDKPFSVGDCLGEGAQYLAEFPSPHSSIMGFSNDPSFFSAAVLIEYLGQSSNCGHKVIAAAPLIWTMPDLRPELEVRDSGAVDSAGGTVTVGADGEPLTYATAFGDTLPEIAARFGVTVEDVIWLNPCRPGAYSKTGAYEGEVLNLAKALRGARLPHLF